ncbi:hypothetical protein Tco_0756666 [Tanacetum coccineum]
MLAIGSYEPNGRSRPHHLPPKPHLQWTVSTIVCSGFLRRIIVACILEGPYTPTTVIVLAVPATDYSLEDPEQTIVDTVLNMSPGNKAHYESKKEAIHLILTRIGDEIYSTLDISKTTHEMWEAIERL